MEFQKEAVICTPRLKLRALEEADREDMLNLLTHEQVGKTYMVPEFAARADAIPLFQRLMGFSQDVSRFFYGIELENRVVGMIHIVDITDGEVELGYAIHPDFWGRGIATEALGAAMENLFRAGYEMVCAGAFDHNPASMRVMEKCGMTRQSYTDEIEYRGLTHTCIYYAITKEG